MTTGQTSPTKKAWQTLASKKYLKNVNIGKIDDQNSLYLSYQAGWLNF